MLQLIISGAILTRADGWGPIADAPKWQYTVSKVLGLPVCSALFALAAWLAAGNIITALLAGVAFALWRMPAFHGWEKWGAMFIRGVWPTAIGFTALSLWVHGHGHYGLLCLAMGVGELIYPLVYTALKNKIPDRWKHPIVELGSGAWFALLIAIILGM